MGYHGRVRGILSRVAHDLHTICHGWFHLPAESNERRRIATSYLQSGLVEKNQYDYAAVANCFEEVLMPEERRRSPTRQVAGRN